MESFITQIIANSTKPGPAIETAGEALYWRSLGHLMVRTQAFLATEPDIKNVLLIAPEDIQSMSLALGLIASGVQLTVANPFTDTETLQEQVIQAGVTHIITVPKIISAGSETITGKILRAQLKHPTVANLNALGVPVLTVGGKGEHDITEWLKIPKNKPLPEYSFPEPDLNAPVMSFFPDNTEPHIGYAHTHASLTAALNRLTDSIDLTSPPIAMLAKSVYTKSLFVGIAALNTYNTWVIPTPKDEPKHLDNFIWFASTTETEAWLDKIENSKKLTQKPLYNTVAVGMGVMTPELYRRIQKNVLTHSVYSVVGAKNLFPILSTEITSNTWEENEHTIFMGEPLDGIRFRSLDNELEVTSPHSPTPLQPSTEWYSTRLKSTFIGNGVEILYPE